MERALRDAVWRRAEGRCEHALAGVRCNRECDRANWTGHVHHLIYRGHGRERLDDLELVCLRCHGLVHPNRKFFDRETQEKIAGVRRARPLDARDGLTRQEQSALTRGAGRWAWRPT